MKTPRTRREFLTEVGCGMLVAAVGADLASELGLAQTIGAEEAGAALNFGRLEPLVVLMQETPVAGLLPILAEKLRSGVELRQLVAAGALANARTFGGEDYIGFHTIMALGPALSMTAELPPEQQALPVFKVLYRNSNRIQERGGRKDEVLHSVTSSAGGAEDLRAAVHARDAARAEQVLAGRAEVSDETAFNDLLHTVQEAGDVHRVVLPYRAWDLLGVIGREHALTMLRQSVRYCVKNEAWADRAPYNQPRGMLPKLLEEHRLLDRSPGERAADDAWVTQFTDTLFTATAEQAAEAAAAALAEGFSPATIGEAISLAANQLLLRDHGRTPRDEVAGKPLGSVHGDSIGVHASDSANAWRNLARAGNPRNSFACLIVGAWQVAKDRVERGGDFAHWEPLPLEQHLGAIKATDAASLLRDLDEAVRGNLQARAAALTARYGALGLDARGVFDLLLRYAISEDGALHGEKYYRTVTEDFHATRPGLRWRHLTALARVTASEYGRPAAGMEQARELLRT